MNKLNIIIPVVLFFMFLSPLAQGNDDFEIITVIATSKIEKNNENISKVKRKALLNALNLSVQRAMVDMMTVTKINQGLEFLYSLINLQKYVLSYRVIAELEKRTHYIVAVESKINAVTIEKLFIEHRIIDKKTNIQETIIKTKIQGKQYFTNFIKLKRILKKIKGIQDIQTKEISSDYALVNIIFNGSTEKFTNTIREKTFDSFAIEISDIINNSLVIKFIPNQLPLGRSDFGQ
ncbi:MAG: hypothetical protein B6I26_02350 [Desulfobacteraceae bacterium 4572_130]|nr:MAG: hypothetical protein B6I26_02350 [Desulfobacteraceae bacterium 4572_130]